MTEQATAPTVELVSIEDIETGGQFIYFYESQRTENGKWIALDKQTSMSTMIITGSSMTV